MLQNPNQFQLEKNEVSLIKKQRYWFIYYMYTLSVKIDHVFIYITWLTNNNGP